MFDTLVYNVMTYDIMMQIRTTAASKKEKKEHLEKVIVLFLYSAMLSMKLNI